MVTPQYQPVAVALLLDDLVHSHRAEAERKGLWLSLRVAARAHGATSRSDPLLLERVLRNLIVNAVRHTHRGGVLVTLRARGGGWRVVPRRRFCVLQVCGGAPLPAVALRSIDRGAPSRA